ncbi:hypothetical protein NDU88_008172 [Pleurodeles waltl]|uniref:Uncharacterized protein n=1 Tax=Pleurodeles waltl TaxID=8319 RepID=A0AAV7PND7_PLEWA|nr:hypothetical protein NDU88_008172 [Pleurodeles waltl]
MAAPPRLGPETRLRRGGDPVLRPSRSGRGGQPAVGNRDAGKVPLAASIQMAGGRLPTGRSRRWRLLQGWGQRRGSRRVETQFCIRPDPAEEGSLPAGPRTWKSAFGCLNAKAVRLRDRRGAGDLDVGQSPVLARRVLDISRTLNPRPGWQGPGRSSGGGAPEVKKRSGFTLKSDPVPRELLEVRPSRRPS